MSEKLSEMSELEKKAYWRGAQMAGGLGVCLGMLTSLSVFLFLR